MRIERRLLAIVAVASLAAMVGCSKDTPATGPTPTGNATAAGSTTPAATPVATAGASDVCALMIKIATDSGMMVNRHYVPPNKETLDMLKYVVTTSLTVRDQLAAGLPPDVKAAFDIEMQYFQALKDSNYTAAPPAGFEAANTKVNAYQVSVCGVTFDQ